MAGAILAAHPTPPAVGDATYLPPAKGAIIIGSSIDEAQESRKQGPLDVDTTPSVDINKPPAVIAGDLAPSPSAETTIEHVGDVQNLTPSNDAAVERTTMEPVVSTTYEEVIAQATQASHQAELTRVGTERLAEDVAEELAVKEEADRAARDAAEKARIEQEAREAEKEKERQTQLKLVEEYEAKPFKADEAERAQLETAEPQHQSELVERQTLEEGEREKLRGAEIEIEAARLEAEHKEHEQARLLANEKEIEEASDCPVAPSTPRSELSFITSGFDSPSQVSLASHVPAAPDSPRIAPDDPTPFVELPESDLILQNRSPKSINSSIAGEAPETPLGSLPNDSFLAVGGFFLTCLNAC